MTYSPSAPERADRDERWIFRMINAAFWLCWAGIAVILATAWVKGDIGGAGSLAPLVKAIAPVDARGAAVSPDSIGSLGKAVVLGIELLYILVTFSILVPMHRMIHLCAYHDVWLARTMRNLTYLAVLLVATAVVDPVLLNLGRILFYVLGESHAVRLSLSLADFDLMNLAAALFVLVLRLIMKQAVNMHREQELTV